MALDKAGLKAAIVALMTNTNPQTIDAAADKMSDAIDSFVRGASVSVSIPASSIVTSGTAVTQTGPALPLNLSGSIS